MSKREALVIPSFDDTLDDFTPRRPDGQGGEVTPPSSAQTRRTVDAISHFPSREASEDGQLNLKGPKHVLDRFRALCKADRRAYYDMLEILMDHLDRPK
ncbi:MAG: hypothetical protein AB8B71_11480 [Paracoccaceae bacterium]